MSAARKVCRNGTLFVFILLVRTGPASYIAVRRGTKAIDRLLVSVRPWTFLKPPLYPNPPRLFFAAVSCNTLQETGHGRFAFKREWQLIRQHAAPLDNAFLSARDGNLETGEMFEAKPASSGVIKDLAGTRTHLFPSSTGLSAKADRRGSNCSVAAQAGGAVAVPTRR